MGFVVVSIIGLIGKFTLNLILVFLFIIIITTRTSCRGTWARLWTIEHWIMGSPQSWLWVGHSCHDNCLAQVSPTNVHKTLVFLLVRTTVISTRIGTQFAFHLTTGNAIYMCHQYIASMHFSYDFDEMSKKIVYCAPVYYSHFSSCQSHHIQQFTE